MRIKLKKTIREYYDDMFFSIKFWIFKHKKNGVIKVGENMSLEDAYKKVRNGGFILIPPKKNGNNS